MKYFNNDIIFKLNILDNQIFNDDIVSKNFFFYKKNTNNNYKVFNLFFLFNFSLFNSYFKVHHNFNLFYIYSYSNKLILIDPIKFFNR